MTMMTMMNIMTMMTMMTKMTMAGNFSSQIEWLYCRLDVALNAVCEFEEEKTIFFGRDNLTLFNTVALCRWLCKYLLFSTCQFGGRTDLNWNKLRNFPLQILFQMTMLLLLFQIMMLLLLQILLQMLTIPCNDCWYEIEEEQN